MPAGNWSSSLLLNWPVAQGSAVLSRLARDLDVDVTIRAGLIEWIAGHDVGRFQVDIASGTPG